MTARKRVLLVEDDRMISHLVELLLGLHGYGAMVAYDGGEALEVLSATPEPAEVFDLVLSDIRMPVVDGYTLLSVVQLQWPALPVVLMSAFDPAEGDDTPFLRKPFDEVQLLAAIQQAIASGRVTDA